jgi:hypothetical protein
LTRALAQHVVADDIVVAVGDAVFALHVIARHNLTCASLPS